MREIKLFNINCGKQKKEGCVKLICLTSVVENRRRKDAIHPSVHLSPDASWVQVPVNHQHLEKKAGNTVNAAHFFKILAGNYKTCGFRRELKILGGRAL